MTTDSIKTFLYKWHLYRFKRGTLNKLPEHWQLLEFEANATGSDFNWVEVAYTDEEYGRVFARMGNPEHFWFESVKKYEDGDIREIYVTAVSMYQTLVEVRDIVAENNIKATCYLYDARTNTYTKNLLISHCRNDEYVMSKLWIEGRQHSFSLWRYDLGYAIFGEYTGSKPRNKGTLRMIYLN